LDYPALYNQITPASDQASVEERSDGYKAAGYHTSASYIRQIPGTAVQVDWVKAAMPDQRAI